MRAEKRSAVASWELAGVAIGTHVPAGGREDAEPLRQPLLAERRLVDSAEIVRCALVWLHPSALGADVLFS
eukprot:SAG11_NODE_5581_length_1518_cov_1.315011_2_plen_71_part_00